MNEEERRLRAAHPPDESCLINWTELRVAGSEAGLRLDVFLSRRFGRSRNRITALAGRVFDAEGRQLGRFSHRLKAGERIRVQGRRHPEPPIEVRYRVMFQDRWLVAVDKGAGAPVHPSHGMRRNTLLGKLRKDLGDESLLPAHRLDRETSGVVIFGRGKKATSALMRSFSSAGVQKTYLALVRGRPDFEQLRVELAVGRDDAFPIRCRMRVDEERGKPAVTEFRVLGRGDGCALVEAGPRTGRQHQIRVHLASLGHPVLGDKLYQFDGRYYLAMLRDELDEDACLALGHTRQALCAWRLSLEHPFTRRRLDLTAPPAEDFMRLLCTRLVAWPGEESMPGRPPDGQQ